MSETVEIDRYCSACSGRLLQETVFEYVGDPMNMIVGPGSRNQMSKRTTTYCGECGALYRNGTGLTKPRLPSPVRPQTYK